MNGALPLLAMHLFELVFGFRIKRASAFNDTLLFASLLCILIPYFGFFENLKRHCVSRQGANTQTRCDLQLVTCVRCVTTTRMPYAIP